VRTAFAFPVCPASQGVNAQTITILSRFLIDNPDLQVRQAAAMWMAVAKILELCEGKEDPLIPYPSTVTYIRKPPAFEDVMTPEFI